VNFPTTNNQQPTTNNNNPMSAVKFGADTSGLTGMMNFQGTIDGMSSALKEANAKLNEAQSNMKSGDPTSVVNAQIAMASFSQVLTSFTNMLKGLQDVTSTINRNISG
jgi:hypothetical protein